VTDGVSAVQARAADPASSQSDFCKRWVEHFSLLNDPPIARAFAEMASRLAADFSVQTLCRSVGLIRSTLTAKFTAAFGESPMSILRRLRMRHAAGLLAANALSIEQVALHAGYQSRSSFTRTFWKHYGTDPSSYRSEAKRVFGCVSDRRRRRPA
jgi:AraC family transcriptional activator of mtrCDE